MRISIKVILLTCNDWGRNFLRPSKTHFKPASFLKGAVFRFGMFVSYPKVTRELGN